MPAWLSLSLFGKGSRWIQEAITPVGLVIKLSQNPCGEITVIRTVEHVDTELKEVEVTIGKLYAEIGKTQTKLNDASSKRSALKLERTQLAREEAQKPIAIAMVLHRSCKGYGSNPTNCSFNLYEGGPYTSGQNKDNDKYYNAALEVIATAKRIGADPVEIAKLVKEVK